MATTTYNSKQADFFMAFETTNGVAVTPSIEVPAIDISPEFDAGIGESRGLLGNVWKRQVDKIYNPTSATGTVAFYCHPNLIGNIFKWFAGAPSTSGPTSGIYTHVFTPSSTITSATIQIGWLDVPFRLFGAVAETLTIKYEEHTCIVEIGFFAKDEFSVRLVKTAISATDTTAILDDQKGKFKPTLGLTTNDDLIFDDGTTTEELEVVAINANNKTLTTSAFVGTFDVGDKVYLKPITPTNPTRIEPFNFGRMAVTVDGATYEATNSMEIVFTKEFLKEGVAGSRSDAAQSGVQSITVEVSSLDKIYTGINSSLYDKLLHQTFVDTIFTYTGLDAGTGQSNQLIIDIPKLTLTGNAYEGKQPTGTETARDTFSGEGAYSSVDGYAGSLSLKNETASY